MDSSGVHPSRSVAITVASDTEPVECEGTYRATDGGFVLEFCAGETAYIISHGRDTTRLKASGLLSYELDFGAGGASAVEVPFGSLDIVLRPQKREVDITADGVFVALAYELSGMGTDTVRTVDVAARFMR